MLNQRSLVPPPSPVVTNGDVTRHSPLISPLWRHVALAGFNPFMVTWRFTFNAGTNWLWIGLRVKDCVDSSVDWWHEKLIISFKAQISTDVGILKSQRGISSKNKQTWSSLMGGGWICFMFVLTRVSTLFFPRSRFYGRTKSVVKCFRA